MQTLTASVLLIRLAVQSGLSGRLVLVMPAGVHCKLEIEVSRVGLQATVVSSTTVLGWYGSWVHVSLAKTLEVTVPPFSIPSIPLGSPPYMPPPLLLSPGP